jgi:excisionase family DNA binding protein
VPLNTKMTPDTGTNRCRSVRELAHYWKTSPKRIREMVRRGTLRAFVVGSAVRIPPDAVAECEQRLAAPGPRVRHKRQTGGISPDVVALLSEGRT